MPEPKRPDRRVRGDHDDGRNRRTTRARVVTCTDCRRAPDVRRGEASRALAYAWTPIVTVVLLVSRQGSVILEPRGVVLVVDLGLDVVALLRLRAAWIVEPVVVLLRAFLRLDVEYADLAARSRVADTASSVPRVRAHFEMDGLGGGRCGRTRV